MTVLNRKTEELKDWYNSLLSEKGQPALKKEKKNHNLNSWFLLRQIHYIIQTHH